MNEHVLLISRDHGQVYRHVGVLRGQPPFKTSLTSHYGGIETRKTIETNCTFILNYQWAGGGMFWLESSSAGLAEAC
jgi:hypothetical protein